MEGKIFRGQTATPIYEALASCLATVEDEHFN